MNRAKTLCVVPGYLALALLYTWPLAARFGRAIPAGSWSVDALLQAFVLGWDLKSFGRLQRVFDAPIFHPARRALTSMDHLLGEAFLAWPVRALGGGLAEAYNTLVWFSFVFTGWAGYRLARTLGASRAAAFLGGFLLAFGPYRIANLGNLNQLHTGLLTLAIFWGVRFLARGSARDLACAVAMLGVQAWFGWYGVFHLTVALALLVGLAGAWGGTMPGTRRWVVALGTGLGAVLVAFPVAWPYLEQARAHPEFRRTLGQAALYSADVRDYFMTGTWSRLEHAWPLGASDRAFGVGIVTLLLALVGLRSMPRGRGPHRFLVALGVAGFVLSLGPVLQVAGHRLPVPLPYAALHEWVPGFASMRAPGRFAVLVLVVAAMLAARGYDAWRRRAPSGPKAVALASLVACAAFELLPKPIALVELPRADSMPPVYRWLAREEGDFAIVELPLPASEAQESERDALRQIRILDHGKASLDGVSGFSPPDQERFRRIMAAFPDSSSVLAARERGARYLIVHRSELPAGIEERFDPSIAAPPGLSDVARFGSDVVYALGRAPSVGR